MDVYINPEGVAEITEVWEANLTQGTEGYKPYGNLGNCKITNFSVSDDSGITYTNLSNWDSNKSFDSKIHKCGIINKSDRIELCWGISKYGNTIYTLKYNITNFVNQYSDSQGVYFSLMPKEMEQSPKSVVITIHSDKQFTEKNSQIWAFGHKGGNINFQNGNIVMNSNGILNSSSYMTALIKIENGMFYTTNKVSKTFNAIYDEAMSDVPENEKAGNKDDKEITSLSVILSVLGGIIFLPLSLLMNPIVWIILVAILVYKKGNHKFKTIEKLDFGPDGKNLPNEKDIDYYRDIPCNKDLYRAYWIISEYGIKEKSNVLLGAILLNWIKEGKAYITKTKKGLFSFKDNNYSIDLNRISEGKNKVEDELIKVLKEASGDNGILEAKEFEKWCKNHYSYFENWNQKVMDYGTNLLQEEGIITTTETTEENKGFIKGTRTIVTKHVNPSMKEEAIKLLGLKKFLLDYSMIEQRQAIEVHLWEEYLIFAQLFGIAEKVEEQFSKIYPEFKEQSRINIEYTTIYTRQMVEIGMRAAEKARERAERRESYSSGGGGSSYSGGGSSARGSSSGGGFR